MKPAAFTLAMLGTVVVSLVATNDAVGDPSGSMAGPPPSSAEGAPQSAASPVVTFLRAADVNDFKAMEALLDGGSAKFLKLISNCYLRRVYANNQSNELIAAWMCAEGANRSRVVLADLALTSTNKVAVSVQLNNSSNRPAPGRTGSAFAD